MKYFKPDAKLFLEIVEFCSEFCHCAISHTPFTHMNQQYYVTNHSHTISQPVDLCNYEWWTKSGGSIWAESVHLQSHKSTSYEKFMKLGV